MPVTVSCGSATSAIALFPVNVIVTPAPTEMVFARMGPMGEPFDIWVTTVVQLESTLLSIVPLCAVYVSAVATVSQISGNHAGDR